MYAVLRCGLKNASNNKLRVIINKLEYAEYLKFSFSARLTFVALLKQIIMLCTPHMSGISTCHTADFATWKTARGCTFLTSLTQTSFYHFNG